MPATDTSATKSAAYRPFECSICHSRFTRHENLKRHENLHSTSPEETSLPCGQCSSTFSRADLRRRHIKRKHPEIQANEVTDVLQRGSTYGVVNKRLRLHHVIEEGQETSLAELRDDREIDGDSATWNADKNYDQQQNDVTTTQLHAGHGNRSTSGTYTTDKSSVSENILTQATQQPWMTDTRYIDHFIDEVDNPNTRQTDSSIIISRHEFGAPLQSTITASTHASNHSPSSYMLSPTASDVTGTSLNRTSPSTIQWQDDWFPSPNQTARGLELYFHHISHFIPFIHQPTFDEPTVPPVLILSMLSLAYQYGEDPTCENEQGSGKALALHCFNQARGLLRSREELTEDSPLTLGIVQAYLMVEICAIMYLCGKSSAYGFRAHPKMIALARSGGVLQPKPVATVATKDLESLWREFVRSESHKRTAFAIHQLDAMLYQLLSVPRSLSHLEIKHDLPCPLENWSAASAAEWAHQRLINGHSSASISYVEAVRLFLSPEPKLDSLPNFDSYGAINIAQFLISSAREISGWSAMTGRISLERFEPLRSSLEALRPFISVQAGMIQSIHATALEATWEIAMIELQMWSPSHTGGIIGETIDTVLKEWTSACLGPWSETLFNASKALQPHVDWYLQYLDNTLNAELEPPWITLYAYKAYLIAWRLLRGGVGGAMQIVGVSDGSHQSATSWAKAVFARRKNWNPGKLILTSLELLPNMDNVG